MEKEMKIRPRDLYITVNKDKNIKLCVLNNQRTKAKILTDNKIIKLLNSGEIEEKAYYEPWIDYDESIYTYSALDDGKVLYIQPLVLNSIEQKKIIKDFDFNEGKELPDAYYGDSSVMFMNSYLNVINASQVNIMNALLSKLCGYDANGKNARSNFDNDNRFKPLNMETIAKIENVLNKIKNKELTKFNANKTYPHTYKKDDLEF